MCKFKQYILVAAIYFCLGAAPFARAENQSAAAVEFAPVIAYFPVLPEGALDAQPQLVPVASNHPLDGDHKGLSRAIIIVHDASRDAGDALSAIMALAGTSNATTMVVAPQFLIESDLALFSERLPDHGHAFARWPLGMWEEGGDSVTLTQKGVSSFTVTDILLFYLSDKRLFPDLAQIIIAGLGTGADFTLRYAAAGRAADILEKDGTPVRFIVANPSSYLYFTSSRPRNRTAGFGPPDIAACPRFDAWPYGLQQLNTYVHKTGANTIKLKGVKRKVTYLISLPAPGDAGADTSCAAMLQGGDTASRAANYNLYLSLMYSDARKTQFFAPLIKGNSSAVALFGSACGMTQLFGAGDCAEGDFRNAKNQQ